MNIKKLTDDQIERICNYYEFNKDKKLQFKYLRDNEDQSSYKQYPKGRKYNWLVARELLRAPTFHLPRLELLENIKEEIDNRTARWDGAVDMYFLEIQNLGIVNRSDHAGPYKGWIELNQLGQVFLGLTLEDLAPEWLLWELYSILNENGFYARQYNEIKDLKEKYQKLKKEKEKEDLLRINQTKDQAINDQNRKIKDQEKTIRDQKEIIEEYDNLWESYEFERNEVYKKNQEISDLLKPKR